MFYHLSDTWTKRFEIVRPRLCPREEGIFGEPCICVCPSIPQCLIALGEWRDYKKLFVYRIAETVAEAIPASFVFDYPLTQEHRIYKEKIFTKVGELPLDEIKKNVSKLPCCGLSDSKLLKNLAINLKEIEQFMVDIL